MRKWLIFLLTVTMLMSFGVVALAETVNDTPNIAVRYGASETYIVTIPEAVVIDIAKKAGTGELRIADVLISSGKTLRIRVSSETATGKTFRLSDGNKKLQYQITTQSSNIACDNNAVVLEMTAGKTEAAEVLQFKLLSEPTENGHYTDQLTFTIEIT